MASDSKIQGSVIGTKIGGYEVEALIGRGAMGSVYLARDTKLKRYVALKVLLGSLARTPSIVKQFRQEAQAAAPLHHPNIVRIYSAGMDEGTPYIAMEFVDGEPLDRFLARKGKVTWDVALHVGAQIASALDCAHQHGVVHRDVKPSNILVDRRGGVRLTDFGIARMQSEGDGSNANVVGTPQYMSPEQVTGREVGPASDLFSLGVTMYQMIAGELPFRGESSMALVKSICEDNPPRLNRLISSVPDDVARLVAYLMEKEPAGRPASAKVVYGLIHRLQKQRGVATTVADSITAFLKEEMEARPFSSLERRQAQARKKSRRVQRKLSPIGRALRLTPHVLAILALAIGAFMLGPLAARRARAALPDPAREIGLADRSLILPGVRRVMLYTDGFEVQEMAWADGSKLVVRMRGQRGRLTDGEEGIVTVDAESGRVLNLVPPFRRAQIDLVKPAGILGVGGPYAGANRNSPFFGAIPVLATGDRPRTMVLLAQRVDTASPSPKILFEIDAMSASTPDAVRTETGRALAIHPDGTRVCLLMQQDEDGTAYLVERDVNTVPPELTGPRKTSSYMDIIAGSVHYTPDGRRIAYLARTQAGVSELRLVNSGDGQMDGQKIVSPVRGSGFAFAPDSRRVVVAIDTIDGLGRVAIVDIGLREVAEQFGPGSVSPQAWIAGRDAFVYAGHLTAADASRGIAPQPIVVELSSRPGSMRVIASLPDGVGPAYAVNEAGRIIAAEVRDSRGAGVYLIDVDTISR